MGTGGGTRLSNDAEEQKPGIQPTPHVAPLYQRLPRGPHRLDRETVRSHQRARIHGAMVEAVARNGYHGASVKEVIGLAGVSRRSFYEQFANKQECFLATFDVIARREIQRMRRAFVRAEGDFDSRIRAVFDLCEEDVRQAPKATLLVLVVSQTAGPTGTLRLRRAAASCSELLARGLACGAQAQELPAPVLRAITGGLHGAVAIRLLAAESGHQEQDDLAGQMHAWTTTFPAHEAGQLAPVLQERLRHRMRELGLAHRHAQQADMAREDLDERTLLLDSMLRLVAVHPYDELAAPQVAEEAGLVVDTFFEHFPDRDACLRAALAMVGEELLQIASDPELAGGDWPMAVRRTLDRLLRYVGEHPLHARTLVHHSCVLGAETLDWSMGLSVEIAERLMQGAPQAPSPFARDALAGALWHTIRCQVTASRIPMLGALGDYMSYVALTPLLGAAATVELLGADEAAA